MRVWVESVQMTATSNGYTVDVRVGSDTYDSGLQRPSADVRLVPADVREALLGWLTSGGPAEPPVNTEPSS